MGEHSCGEVELTSNNPGSVSYTKRSRWTKVRNSGLYPHNFEWYGESEERMAKRVL